MLVALCAVFDQTALAALITALSGPDAPTVIPQATLGVGTTSTCGMREAPHLAEHMLLSSTEYGENPVDTVITLRAKGITPNQAKLEVLAYFRRELTLYTARAFEPQNIRGGWFRLKIHRLTPTRANS